MLERSRLIYLVALLACALVFAGLCVLSPHVAMDVRLAYALGFALVSAEIVLVSRYAVSERPLVLLVVVAAALTVLWSQRGAPITVSGALVVATALLVGAGALGTALGARIERPGHLLAVALVSAAADLWSVYSPEGLSAKMAEEAARAPDTLTLFALPWPMLGTGRIEPMIGAGDILFTALYLAAFERHGLALRRAVAAMLLAYALGLLAILVTERPVPLLPLLGAAAVLADARARSLPAHERRTVLLVFLALCAVLAVRFLR